MKPRESSVVERPRNTVNKYSAQFYEVINIFYTSLEPVKQNFGSVDLLFTRERKVTFTIQMHC